MEAGQRRTAPHVCRGSTENVLPRPVHFWNNPLQRPDPSLFPNSQRLLFIKRVHGPLLNSLEGDRYIGEFLNKPRERLQGQQNIEAY